MASESHKAERAEERKADCTILDMASAELPSHGRALCKVFFDLDMAASWTPPAFHDKAGAIDPEICDYYAVQVCCEGGS